VATTIAPEDYARKIDMLLAKAESTPEPAEAEALIEKAQKLCSKYAIDEAMIAAARNGKAPEKIVREEIIYKGTFAKAYFRIGQAVALANECRVLIRKEYSGDVAMVCIGFESDVARVKQLNAAVQIQAAGSLAVWSKEQRTMPNWKYLDKGEKWRNRRQFLNSFGAGLGEQLERARGQATKEAEASVETGSVALVLRDKKDRVDDWVDQTYGKLRRTHSREYGGSSRAYAAGHAAGMRADATSGSGSVRGGSGKQLGA